MKSCLTNCCQEREFLTWRWKECSLQTFKAQHFLWKGNEPATQVKLHDTEPRLDCPFFPWMSQRFFIKAFFSQAI